MYEHRLKQLNPNRRKITYDISDLFSFIDNIPDLSCLVFNKQISAYVPHDKKWMKNRVFEHLKKQAGLTVESSSLHFVFLPNGV